MGVRWEMHPAAHATNDYMVTFDVKNNAIAAPAIPSIIYLQNGLTTQAIVTNLQNLGAKFETLEQGGLPSHRILCEQRQRASASGFRLYAVLSAEGEP